MTTERSLRLQSSIHNVYFLVAIYDKQWLHSKFRTRYIAITKLWTIINNCYEYNVSIICGDSNSSLANLKRWQDQKLASLSNNFYLYKGKSVYKLQVIAAKTIPADDELYSYLENPEINKNNFYSSAKKDSKVKIDEEFKQSDKYVILSVSSSEPSKNDVVICKVKTVDAPQKEENDNTVIVIAILVGLALFFGLSLGSRSHY